MTVLFALSEPVQLAIVVGVNAVAMGVLGLLTIVVNRYLARGDAEAQAARDKAKADQDEEREQAKIIRDEAVAKKVVEVKEKLEQSTTSQTNRLEDIHTLVNSAMGAQKSLLAIALRATANREQTPETIAAAERAEAELADHERKQKKVDDKYAEGHQ